MEGSHEMSSTSSEKSDNPFFTTTTAGSNSESIQGAFLEGCKAGINTTDVSNGGLNIPVFGVGNDSVVGTVSKIVNMPAIMTESTGNVVKNPFFSGLNAISNNRFLANPVTQVSSPSDQFTSSVDKSTYNKIEAKNVFHEEIACNQTSRVLNPFFDNARSKNTSFMIGSTTQVTSSTGNFISFMDKAKDSFSEVKNNIFLEESSKATSGVNPFFHNAGNKNVINNNIFTTSVQPVGDKSKKEQDSTNFFQELKVSPVSKSSNLTLDNKSVGLKSKGFTGIFSSEDSASHNKNPQANINGNVANKIQVRSADYNLLYLKSSLLELGENIKSVTCADSQSKYDVLEKIDREVRKVVNARFQAEDGNRCRMLKGTCTDMCPEKERYFRDCKHQVSPFELEFVQDIVANSEGDYPQLDDCKAVKEYSRSSADQEEPLPHQLRNANVLEYTMDYLIKEIMDVKYSNRTDWFDFLWNRTRAIRKDITQQNLSCPITISIIEKCTRFHIFCSHYLCEHELHIFEPKMNLENLTKCLQTLKHLYEDSWKDTGECYPNESEFRCYQILLNLNDGDMLREVMNFRKDIRESPQVKFALKVFSAVQENNYIRFFKLLKSSSFLNACLLQSYFLQMRSSALRVMVRTYTHSATEDVPFPLLSLQDILLFDSFEDVCNFCSQHGLSLFNSNVHFNRSQFTPLEELYQSGKSAAISSKLQQSMSDIVNNGPVTAVLGHKPMNSFSETGCYNGNYHLLDDSVDESAIEDLSLPVNIGKQHPQPQNPTNDNLYGNNLHQNIAAKLDHSFEKEIDDNEEGCSENNMEDTEYLPCDDEVLSDDEYNDEVNDQCDDSYGSTSGDRVMFLREDYNNYLNEMIDNNISASLYDICNDIIIDAEDELIQSEVMTNQELAIICIEEARVAVAEVINEEKKNEEKKLEEEKPEWIEKESSDFVTKIIQDSLLSFLNLIVEDIYGSEVKQVESLVIDDEIEKQLEIVMALSLNLQMKQIARFAIDEAILDRKKVLKSNLKLFMNKKLLMSFHRWLRTYKQQQLIKSSLIDFPPMPPFVDTKDVLHKLHPDGDISYALPMFSEGRENNIHYVIAQKNCDTMGSSDQVNKCVAEEGRILKPLSSIIEDAMSLLFFKDFHQHCLDCESFLLPVPEPNDIIQFYNNVLDGIHNVLKADTINKNVTMLIHIAELRLPLLPETDPGDWNSSSLECKDFIFEVTGETNSLLLSRVDELLERYLSRNSHCNDILFPWSGVLELCINNKMGSMYFRADSERGLVFSTPFFCNADLLSLEVDNPLKEYTKLKRSAHYMLKGDVSYMDQMTRNKYSREYKLRNSLNNVASHLNQLEASLNSRKLKCSKKKSSSVQDLLNQSTSFLHNINKEKQRRKTLSPSCLDTTVLNDESTDSTEAFDDKPSGFKRTFEDSMLECLIGIEDYRIKIKTRADYWREVLEQ